MNESSGNTTSGNSDDNPDKEFVKRLNNVKEQLLILLWRAENTSVSDKELMKRLDTVNQTLFVIETKLSEAEGKTFNASENANKASVEIDLAENSIIRSWTLVQKIRGSNNNTARMIDQIHKILATWTKTIVRISETVREVRRGNGLIIYVIICKFSFLYIVFFFCQVQNISNAQWNEVHELKKRANDALNNSMSANTRMNEVLKQQADTEQEITFIDQAFNNMDSLGQEVAMSASRSRSAADNVLATAEELLELASVPLDEVNANKTKGKI